MKKSALILVLALGGCATSNGYLYFPDLADRVLAGDEHAFRQVLALAADTPPGERLEELAELSSRFVRLSPSGFLRAQAASSTCFGVSFMGPDYVDNPSAEAQERKLRIAALESVSDPELLPAQERCLNDLAGT
jgi:hypothetical protein